MPIDTLFEAVATTVDLVANTAIESASSSRRRLWVPVWLGAVGAIALLVVVSMPASLLLAAASVVLSIAAGRAWQRSHVRARQRHMATSAPLLQTPARPQPPAGPPFA